MSHDDMKCWDKDGNSITPRKFLEEGVSRGFVQDGQGYIRMRINGRIETVTFLAISREELEKMMPHIIKAIYEP